MQVEKACVCQRLRERDAAGSPGLRWAGTQDEVEREREAPWIRWWWLGLSGSRNKHPYLGSSVYPSPFSLLSSILWERAMGPEYPRRPALHCLSVCKCLFRIRVHVPLYMFKTTLFKTKQI